MKDISVYVVRTGFRENLAGAFVSKDAAIEHIAGRIRENSGTHPEVKLEGGYRISVPDGWTSDGTSRFVYALLQHTHEAAVGTILGFHATRDEAREAMETRSRFFPELGEDFVPRLEIVLTELHAEF